MAIEYSDAQLTCDEDGITVKMYYFPFGDKRLYYSELRRAEEFRMTALRGKWRLWGGDFRHWLNLDLGRPSKDIAFILHLDGWVRPVLTPDDPSKFREVLENHGVQVGAAS